MASCPKEEMERRHVAVEASKSNDTEHVKVLTCIQSPVMATSSSSSVKAALHEPDITMGTASPNLTWLSSCGIYDIPNKSSHFQKPLLPQRMRIESVPHYIQGSHSLPQTNTVPGNLPSQPAVNVTLGTIELGCAVLPEVSLPPCIRIGDNKDMSQSNASISRTKLYIENMLQSCDTSDGPPEYVFVIILI